MFLNQIKNALHFFLVTRSFSIIPHNTHKYHLKLGFKFIKKKINKFLFLKIKNKFFHVIEFQKTKFFRNQMNSQENL